MGFRSVTGMLPRERAKAAVGFRPMDVVPVEYHPSPAGIWEHGAELRKLWGRYPHDFVVAAEFPDCRPEPRFIGACTVEDGKTKCH